MITLRVSAEEYEAVRVVSKAKGYRSISELARAAIHTLIEDKAPHEILALRINEHASQLSALTREVQRLAMASEQARHLKPSSDDGRCSE